MSIENNIKTAEILVGQESTIREDAKLLLLKSIAISVLVIAKSSANMAAMYGESLGYTGESWNGYD